MTEAFIYMIVPTTFNFWYRIDHVEEDLTNYCNENNIKILDKIVDTTGGTISERPGLIRMLELLGPGQQVICSTISQLSWNSEQLLQIKKHIENVKANIVIVDLPMDFTGIQGEYMFSIAGSYEIFKLKMRISTPIEITWGQNKTPKKGYSIVGGEYIKIKKY